MLASVWCVAAETLWSSISIHLRIAPSFSFQLCVPDPDNPIPDRRYSCLLLKFVQLICSVLTSSGVALSCSNSSHFQNLLLRSGARVSASPPRGSAPVTTANKGHADTPLRTPPLLDCNSKESSHFSKHCDT